MGGFEVSVHRSMSRFGDDVWIRRRAHGGGIEVLRWAPSSRGGEWEARYLAPEEGVPNDWGPSLFIPSELLDPLVRALSDVSPPNSAMERHLGDAIAVRDRLLALVERAGGRR